MSISANIGARSTPVKIRQAPLGHRLDAFHEVLGLEMLLLLGQLMVGGRGDAVG